MAQPNFFDQSFSLSCIKIASDLYNEFPETVFTILETLQISEDRREEFFPEGGVCDENALMEQIESPPEEYCRAMSFRAAKAWWHHGTLKPAAKFLKELYESCRVTLELKDRIRREQELRKSREDGDFSDQDPYEDYYRKDRDDPCDSEDRSEDDEESDSGCDLD